MQKPTTRQEAGRPALMSDGNVVFDTAGCFTPVCLSHACRKYSVRGRGWRPPPSRLEWRVRVVAVCFFFLQAAAAAGVLTASGPAGQGMGETGWK